jgi:hypothetical protein
MKLRRWEKKMSGIIKFPKVSKFNYNPGTERRIEKIEALIHELEYEILKGVQLGDFDEPISYEKYITPDKNGHWLLRFDLYKTNFFRGEK